VSVDIRDLVVSYDGNSAVKQLDMSIGTGKMLVLLGPSGCGKTSTMRSIVGLETPTAGVISVGGRTVFDHAKKINVPVHKRNIGMVFQSYAIWPHRTVAQNVAFPLEMQRVPKKEISIRVEETLETVGLPGFAHRGASQLSGGQMQRVALARSLVMRPEVLLLDEPLSNLDAKLRERLRFELRELQTELKLTSIYVTHDQGEALALADEIVVMRLGEIEQSAAPRELYESPRNKFVADFLGVSNIFDGAVGSDGTSVDVDGVSASWTLSGAAAPGEYAVCVRPEAITVSDEDAAGAATNIATATVKVASYLGSHVRYRVELGLGATLEIEAFRPDRVFAAGDRVSVSVAPSSIQLLER
jgi:iron(III) transport system ATP-binding protein